MKTLLTLLTLAIAYLLAGVNPARAHAVWLESGAQAAKNKPHEVKIFYGEYPEGELEPTAKWYSDLRTLEVWLISPTQQKTRLSLRDATTHLTGSFTPTQEGVYYLTTVHPARELGGTTKYEFSSVVPVLVGKQGAAVPTAVPAAVPLAIVAPPKAHQLHAPVEVQVWKDGQAFRNGKVELMSPEGWVKKLTTNEAGKVVFTPRMKGSYVLEASDYQPETGQWHQQPYTHTWQGATTRILVN